MIAAEAGGESEAAQIMVGWTVVNRMKQTGIKAVSSIPFGQCGHNSMPTLNSLRIAKGILEGTIRDNSQGATNFYTPGRMPIEGETKPHIDIGSGLESVPGITRNGRAVRNYFPRMGQAIPEGANAPDSRENVQVLQGTLMPTFCGNRTGGIGVILLLTAMGSACLAAPWSPDDTAPFERDVAQAADHARRIGCETSSCKAIIAIDEIVKGEMKKYENVNKDILYSDKAARTAARTLNAALLDHRALYAPVCQMSARLLSRFHNGPDVPDIAVPVQLLIESVDMDIRDHGHCAHDLITALPADKANIQIRLGAHALCVNDDNNHRRTRAACDTLIPGMTDPALDP